ncbi:MAG TPA: N-acetylmuramoyl-L-alanine amidase [Bacillales bacterium]|nr:N-acetylmuramoyl-L-alanine amidase [Bacillales bacterium]
MRKKITSLIFVFFIASLYMTEEAGSAHAVNKAKVAVHVLNVRKGAAISKPVIAQVTEGETFTILQERYGWLKIAYDGFRTGWIAGQYTIKSSEPDGHSIRNIRAAIGPHGTDATSRAVKLLYDGTNLRSGPGLFYSVIARGAKGDRFSVLDQTGKWYHIRLPGGGDAFVAAWIVSPLDRPTTVLRGKTIVIDPGHGGIDSGAIGSSHHTLEKKLTLKTAEALAEKLRGAGATVILTRKDDVYISLEERVSTAEQYDADAFISIHYNASLYPEARGVTAYFYTKWKDRPLAAAIQEMLVKRTERESRGARFADYYVLRENNQPATLLELGFLTNPWEEYVVTTAGYQRKVTEAIFIGIKNYFKEKQ